MAKIGNLFISTISILFILGGCSTQNIVQSTETTVKDTTVTVSPPSIRDTLHATTNPDSTVTAVQVKPGTRDTVIYIHYSPVTDTMTVYIKPDSVKVTIRDTVQIVKNTVVEKPPLIMEILTALLPIVLVVGVIVLVLKFAR